jgi:hypothetical protein
VLVARPALAILVRPDRVIAAVAARRRLPDLPWPINPPRGPAARPEALPGLFCD